ncbi:peroxide stress protein YaaA [Micromonospora sp. NPDC049559]|uniref:peroxide stress protein YaaA n=1 Tax=Micromonospora sp. NPDC049559 TaxID=3155923 RepID=UPI0034124A54
MLVLLPPSEGKAAAGSGAALDLARLSLPELTPARERVLESLVGLCAEPDGERARELLGLSPGQGEEVARNARLTRAPALPAGRLYTGVLYDALDLPTLAPAARRAAQRAVLVFSGLWGAVRLTDRIPPYRCPVGARLPGLGGLAAYWRRAMTGPLAEAAGRGLVLDLRSGAYGAMWQPSGPLAERTAAVRVLHEREVDGVPTRSVVSHFNKATKGRLLRDLLAAGARPRDPEQLVAALRDLKYTVEAEEPAPGRPRRLDVVVTEL